MHWVFASGNDQEICVTIENYAVENSSGCIYDWLQYRYDEYGWGNRLCGTGSSVSLGCRKDFIAIWLHTDYAVANGKVEMSYYTKPADSFKWYGTADNSDGENHME